MKKERVFFFNYKKEIIKEKKDKVKGKEKN